jgi:hypothetical protein
VSGITHLRHRHRHASRAAVGVDGYHSGGAALVSCAGECGTAAVGSAIAHRQAEQCIARQRRDGNDAPNPRVVRRNAAQRCTTEGICSPTAVAASPVVARSGVRADTAGGGGAVPSGASPGPELDVHASPPLRYTEWGNTASRGV